LYLAIVDAKPGDRFSDEEEMSCECGFYSTYGPTFPMAHMHWFFLYVAVLILMFYLGSSDASFYGNVGLAIFLDIIAFFISLFFFSWFSGAGWDIRGSLIYLACVLTIIAAVLDIGFQVYDRRPPNNQNSIQSPGTR
jgi:hypothetical protein